MYTHLHFTLMAHCTSGAIRGSVSCSRTLRQGIELATFWLLNDFSTYLLYLLYHCRPDRNIGNLRQSLQHIHHVTKSWLRTSHEQVLRLSCNNMSRGCSALGAIVADALNTPRQCGVQILIYLCQGGLGTTNSIMSCESDGRYRVVMPSHLSGLTGPRFVCGPAMAIPQNYNSLWNTKWFKNDTVISSPLHSCE